MKTIRQEIDSNAPYLTILPIGDIHLGDAQHDKGTFEHLLNRVKTEKDTFCVLLGDLMNNAVRSGVSDVYEEKLTPMQQIQECVKLFGPIKDKILAVIPGNHEARSGSKSVGLDMTQLFCEQLGIEDRYSNTTAIMFIKTGRKKTGKHKDQKVSYSIYMTHGSGSGGRKMGGKINRLVDYGTITSADIILAGHTHSPAVVRQSYFLTDARWGSVVEQDRLFVNTASCLSYPGGYGDTFGYSPSSRKYPELRLSNDLKKAEALL